MLSDFEFRELLNYFNRPWSGYRKVRKGVKKRLRRQMKRLGISSVDQYILVLEKLPEEMAVFEDCMRVTISRFFRDRALWHHLQEQIIPELIRSFPEGVRIWSAGCANGEEVYSLAIILDLLHARSRASILATDLNELNLQRAQQGIYAPSSLKEVSEEIRNNYFVKGPKGKYCINSSLKNEIVWQNHDLLSQPPEGPYHLILLRNNLLTYHQGATLQFALQAIVGHLVPGGFLTVGSHERIKNFSVPLIADKECHHIYRLTEGH